MNADELAARKALLVAQAELERIPLTLAVRDVRAIVSPPRDPARAARMHPAAVRILKIALPLLGLARLSRVVRVLSIGLVAFRLVRSWNGGSRR